MPRALLPLLMLACVAGCVRRDGLNAACQWPSEVPSPLDLRDPGQSRHLDADAALAEELAIRHGDAFRGRETVPDRGRRVDQCTAALVAWIVRIHDVTPDDVERAREHREVRVDAVAVFVPMALLFIGMAAFAADRVRRRFPPSDALRPALVAALLASLALSVAVVALGELWSVVVEMVRVGDGHLSYRAFRLPWGRHRVAIFSAGMVIGWAVMWWRLRRPGREPEGAA